MTASPALPESFLKLPLAHRGLHDRARGVIENSRAAFEAAIARGYGIELDVQRSGDGEAMVFHDHEMPRLTDRPGLIHDYDAATLATIPLLGAADGETIPTFAEVLALVDGRVPLLVEIKDQDGALGPDVGALEARVAGLLAGYRGPVAVMSFNPHSVAAVGRDLPPCPRGLTSCDYDDPDLSVPDYRRAELVANFANLAMSGAAFISHDRRDLANPLVANLKAQGLAVLTWTVRSPEQEAEARKVAQNVTFEGYLAPL